MVHKRLRYVHHGWLPRSSVHQTVVIGGGVATQTMQLTDAGGAARDVPALQYHISKRLEQLDANKGWLEYKEFDQGQQHVTIAPRPGSAAWTGGG